MATTTNYGWTTPDDTALVKDGASAIRTLGSSVDTSVKALNPGTTAGDVDYYASATSKTRLAIGSNGQVLTSNGSVPTWATPASGGMTLLSTTTLSGASTTISGISGSYNNLFIVAYGVNSTSTFNYTIKFNNASLTKGVGQQSANNGTFSQAYSDFGNQNALPANTTTNVCVLNAYNYASTAAIKLFDQKFLNSTFSQGFEASQITGGINTTSAITSIVFAISTGTFSAGTVLVYGVK